MKRFFYAMTAAVSAIAGTTYAAGHTQDTPADVKKAVADGKAVLIDVRETDEWKDGNLKGAKHLALSDLKAGVAEDKLKMIIPTGKIVYLHCAAGGRCLKAADILQKQGYDVRPLKEGYDALLKAGLPKSE
jgi:phage shock protein E